MRTVQGRIARLKAPINTKEKGTSAGHLFIVTDSTFANTVAPVSIQKH
ncbi:hypothetical protein M977_00775 [Buttiauxella gaviniae ATCC 51604]|uniref:Uncharacterized protein n=1 Tax=Buttiauxella gaviniae ATCC 51604 TaxID=1354253 RepID=A0A1B7I4L2_9ENTR|nr:hypothetical protein M977_00775 [Buttiauxella gaviniae ATCC 51604]